MSNRLGGRAGFTLVEVMIALVVTALVLGMVYSSFSAVMDTRERVAASAYTNMTARLVLSRMAREIESAFIVQIPEDAPPEFRYTLFEGAQSEIDGWPADRLSFTTFAHTKRGVDADESDQALVSYECELLPEDEGTGEQLSLIRREWRRIAPPGETQILDPVPVPIAEGIEGFRLRFLESGGEWAEEWDSREARNLDVLPLAVEITLSLPDGTGGVRDYMTVANPRITPIVRRAGSSEGGETVIGEEGAGDGATEEKGQTGEGGTGKKTQKNKEENPLDAVRE